MSNLHSIDHHAEIDNNDIFGFWIYLMSDCILFATLFAGFAVLHTSVYNAPGIKEITNLNYVLAETIVLLLSSFTYGMAILALYKKECGSALCQIKLWLTATFLLGATFVGLEINEFVNLVKEGHSWQSSAALSSFFTLVGTHGLHVFIGLIWMLILLFQLMRFGLNPIMHKRLTYLGLFWSFLDIVWIFVFTVVYLMGSI